MIVKVRRRRDRSQRHDRLSQPDIVEQQTGLALHQPHHHLNDADKLVLQQREWHKAVLDALGRVLDVCLPFRSSGARRERVVRRDRRDELSHARDLNVLDAEHRAQLVDALVLQPLRTVGNDSASKVERLAACNVEIVAHRRRDIGNEIGMLLLVELLQLFEERLRQASSGVSDDQLNKSIDSRALYMPS